MDKSGKISLLTVIIDFICVAVVGIAILMFYLFGEPYRRGFFCDDDSLRHPFIESTVNSSMLYGFGVFLPIFTMIGGEYYYWKKSDGRSSLMIIGRVLPSWIAMAYNKVGLFTYGAVTTVFTTDIAKYTIGRLRPHFMLLCEPDINCTASENQHRYIDDFKCKASNATDHLLKEMRLSFPSGHSSFSAYSMIWLALYLQLRITWKGSKLLKHFLQFVCLMMAWYTAMTRISNYKHHWSDVLAGLGLGTTIALIMVFGVAKPFVKRISSENEEKLRSVEYDAENGTQRRDTTNGHEMRKGHTRTDEAVR